jgi:predicted kinase
MNKKLIITVGLPGSGKSTWAKEQCKNDNTIVRICRDDIRNMLGEYWVPKRESLVTIIETDCIIAALRSKFTTAVIVDATNLNPNSIDRFYGIISTALEEMEKDGVETVIKDFTDVDVETCIARDKARGQAGGMSVGEKVIRDFYDRYIRKS